MRTFNPAGLALGPDKRADRELQLAQMLATGRMIAGAILFTSKYDMFEYVSLTGETEDPLDVQMPIIRAHDKELRPVDRNQNYMLHYLRSDIGFYTRIFMRVLVGKICFTLKLDTKSALTVLCPDIPRRISAS